MYLLFNFFHLICLDLFCYFAVFLVELPRGCYLVLAPLSLNLINLLLESHTHRQCASHVDLGVGSEVEGNAKTHYYSATHRPMKCYQLKSGVYTALHPAHHQLMTRFTGTVWSRYRG